MDWSGAERQGLAVKVRHGRYRFGMDRLVRSRRSWFGLVRHGGARPVTAVMARLVVVGLGEDG